MVYLDSDDDFGALLDILNEWCIAADAKFNISKPEMIPVGQIDHQDRVRANRFVNGIGGTMIPDHIKIAKEEEPIRTLGAWVGNGVVQVDTLARTLEKIDEALDRWELGHPHRSPHSSASHQRQSCRSLALNPRACRQASVRSARDANPIHHR
jgi:hypothetical protein